MTRISIVLGFLLSCPAFLFAQNDLVHQWSVGTKGDRKDVIEDIQRGDDGAIYVTGTFQDTVDMDPGPSVTELISSGGNDIFIAEYDSLGNLEWAEKIGGNGNDNVHGLTLGMNDEIFITGEFHQNCEFDPGPGQAELLSNGNADIFLARYSNTGTYDWAIRLGNSRSNRGTIIQADGDGGLLVGGDFEGTMDFDPDPVGIRDLSSGTNWYTDIFIAKYSMVDGSHIWSYKLGGKSTNYDDHVYDAEVDMAGNIYLTGEFNDSLDADPSDAGTNYIASSEGSGTNNNIFLIKLDPLGGLLWGFGIGNNDVHEEGYAVDVDNSGNVYLSGTMGDVIDLDPGVDSAKFATNGGKDIFLSKYDMSGNYLWGFNIGSNYYDVALDMRLDGQGNIFLGGRSGDWGSTIDLDPAQFSTWNYSTVGNSDVIVGKYTTSGAFVSGFGVGSNNWDGITSIEVDTTGSVWIGGYHQSDIDMDPGQDTALLTANGYEEGFLAQYCAPPTISIDTSAFQDTVCVYASPFTLSGGSPSGGMFSGPGVSGNMFYPTNAGVGTHQITYTFVNENGCSNSISVPITVEPKPSTPQIDRPALDTLMSSITGDHYHWYRDGGSYGIDSRKVEVTQAGNYRLVVEKDGCFSDTSAPFCFIPLEITDRQDASCGNSDGSATVEVVGGNPGNYEFDWSSGDTVPTATDLAAGLYEVRVTDTLNGCENKITVNISDLGGPIVSTNVTHVSCNGGSDGAISIGVSGQAPPYSVNWSHGGTGNSVNGLSAGYYDLTVTDTNDCKTFMTIQVTEPDPLELTTTTSPAGCGNSNGSATVSISGGTTPYKVDWLNIGGPSDPLTMTNLSSGVYTVEVRDTNGCIATANAVVNETNAPVVTVDNISLAACDGSGGGLDIDVQGGVSPYAYSWSNGATTQDISGVQAGTYWVSVTGANGCTAHLDTTIGVQPPPQEEICLVTVDSSIGMNTIVWENDSNYAVDHINIYRESSQSNVYMKVGERDADSISYFVDSLADPRVHSWRYKISTVDTCGNESALSPFHETIHLTTNVGLSGDINLIWDDYIGFSYSQFAIERYTPSTGWTPLTSLSSNFNTYTDTANVGDSVAYAVKAVPPFGCLATARSKGFNSTRSNRKDVPGANDDGGSSIPSFSEKGESKLLLYPNPTDGDLTMSIFFKQATGGDAKIIVWNMQGAKVFEDDLPGGRKSLNRRIDLKALSPGIYSVQVLSKGVNLNDRVVIE